MLLGPASAVEVYVPDNQVSMRTLGRAVLAMVVAGAVSVVIILGLSLPAGLLVETWPRFRWAWIIAFVAGAFIAKIVGRRRAV
jgi:hypothetical protein